VKNSREKVVCVCVCGEREGESERKKERDEEGLEWGMCLKVKSCKGGVVRREREREREGRRERRSIS
jgi:hypothetical protein